MVWSFKKQVYIRLSDDGSGFVYTVQYGRLRLSPRLVRPVEHGEEPVALGMPVTPPNVCVNKQRGTAVPEKKE